MVTLGFGHIGEHSSTCDHVSNPKAAGMKDFQKEAWLHCKYGRISSFEEVGVVKRGCYSMNKNLRVCKDMTAFKAMYADECIGKHTCKIDYKVAKTIHSDKTPG